ncbi:BEACH domain-containing lvsC [Gossypium arboreum]|uniref:BEACH domain-containing lvsC n=1 Tax=Gossypium arboreum TaxID=29729 RepID=A0A0B0NDC4_GOSAR|nr:BEACH domain-containing lvsC [Gossypium arboreum]
MKILCWNVCGLGSPRIVRRLRQVVKSYYPRLVFFFKTKIDENRIEKVRRCCDFNYGIEVGTTGSRDGLCLAWKEDVNVELKNYSKKSH